jgi:hypothetical protein
MEIALTNSEKLITLILEDESVAKLLTTEARKSLYLKHLDSRSVSYPSKTLEIADLYRLGKKFGVHKTPKVLSDYLGVSTATLDGRLHMARVRGELEKVSR